MSELVALQQRGFDPFGAIMRGEQAAQQSKLSDLMMQQKQQEMQWAGQDRESAITANKEALRQKILGNAYKALTNPEMTPPQDRQAAWQAVNQQLQSKFGFGLGSDQYSDDALRGLGIETGALQSGGGEGAGVVLNTLWGPILAERNTGRVIADYTGGKFVNGQYVDPSYIKSQLGQQGQQPQQMPQPGPQNPNEPQTPSQASQQPPGVVMLPSDIQEQADKKAKFELERKKLEQQARQEELKTKEEERASKSKQEAADFKIQEGLSAIDRLLAPDSGAENAFGVITSKMPTLRQSTASAEVDIGQIESILTSENLDLLSGVLSDNDLKMLREIATGQLDYRNEWPKVRDALIRMRGVFVSRLNSGGQTGQRNQSQGTYQSSSGVQFKVVQP